jgi:porin
MIRNLILPAVILIGQFCSAQARNQTTKAESTEPGIEHLNLLGADIHMPPFNDTILGSDSDFRRAFYSKGLALRSNSTITYSQDIVNSPVPADQQVYMGQRPFGRLMANPILTYDMRHFHLRESQLYFAAGLNWVSWNNAGPNSITMSALYLYKAFADGRIEAKAGYISNDFEFVGLQVGGSLSTGSQGVYAVLPYEVGLSRFPLTAPSFNLKLNGPKNLYFKTAVQRSLDPSGGIGTISRNATGFRFMPNGDKLVNVFEAGFNQMATADAGQTWIRAGYIRNTTPYQNSRTGVSTSGNFCAYILADQEIYISDVEHPSHGIYVGASAIGTAMDLNAYTRYYEFRLYDQAPFQSRPNDTASLVASYSTYNPWLLKNLIAQNKTVWRNASTVTASYNLHLSRGVFMSTGLSYHAGSAITPRVPNSLVFSAILNAFF